MLAGIVLIHENKTSTTESALGRKYCLYFNPTYAYGPVAPDAVTCVKA